MPAAIYGGVKYGQPLYGELAPPKLLSVRLGGRKSIDLTFDVPVRVSNRDLIPRAPASPITAVDWTAKGGTSEDAANPANYAITRPVGGTLSGGGEAIDVVIVWAKGLEGYTSEKVEGGNTIVYATVVRAYFDFQTTPWADYRITLSNLVSQTGGIAIAAPDNSADFDGLVVSHVPRASLHLYDILPKPARDMDTTGELQAFCTALQEVYDRLTNDIDAFFDELCMIEYIREEFIDGLLYDLGDQFSEQFDLTTIEKRRLARTLVLMYKNKGTCPGIVFAINFMLGITIQGCVRGWDDTGGLYKGSYPAPTGGTFILYKGAYPAPTPGGGHLGPVGAQIRNLWLVHAAPGALTAEELTRIAAVVDLMKPATAHYKGVIAP